MTTHLPQRNPEHASEHASEQETGQPALSLRETFIRIGTPLPMDVAGTLLRAIGTVYPSAAVVADPPQALGFDAREAMCIRIDPEDRYDGPLGIEPDRVDPNSPIAEVAGFRIDEDQKAWASVAPQEDLTLFLGDIAHRVFTETEGAVNFVEWTVRATSQDPAVPGREYLLTIARAPLGQPAPTPGALLAEARERISELEARIAALTGETADPEN